MGEIILGLGFIAFGVFCILTKDEPDIYTNHGPPWLWVIGGLVWIIVGIGLLITV